MKDKYWLKPIKRPEYDGKRNRLFTIIRSRNGDGQFEEHDNAKPSPGNPCIEECKLRCIKLQPITMLSVVSFEAKGDGKSRIKKK